MKHFDLVVIGSGSANIIIDEAIKKGYNCAIVENGKFGGTCLTRGCIPTKVMVSVADYIRHSKKLEKIGINIDNISIDFDKISKRVWKKIDESNDVLNYYLEKTNLTVYQATAKFVSDKSIRIIHNDISKGEEIITADKVVIGAGARTKVPKVEGLEDIGYITSETFFGKKYPKQIYDSLTIVGGGYIGVEFAHIFSALGSKVTIVQHNKRLVPKGEEEISKKVLSALESYGIEVFTDVDTVKSYNKDGLKCMEIKNITTGKVDVVSSQEIFICPGVVSNADLLDIKNTDVETDKKGYIKTNEFLETTVDGVYALGDINGLYQFRHKANYEAEILAHNLFEVGCDNQDADINDYKFVSYDVVPSVTYIYPQVAHVGLTEKEARENYDNVKVAKKYYSQTAKGYSLGYDFGDEDDGFAKVIVDADTDKILGVHIIGDEAAILLQPYVEMMNTGIIEYSIINDDISTDFSDKIRNDENYDMYLQPKTLEVTNNTMVSHPSLAEVSIWTKYMDFK